MADSTRASGDKDSGQKPKTSVVLKRNRNALSCMSCQYRKLKCDRGQPCSACVRKHVAATCSYGKLSQNFRDEQKLSPEQMRKKIMQLENRISELEQAGGQSHSDSQDGSKSPSPSYADFLACEGNLEHHGKGTSYYGSTHWSALLPCIEVLHLEDLNGNELRSTLPETEETPLNGPICLFSAQTSYTLNDILTQYLPPKAVIDQLLCTYFHTKYLVDHIIHKQQFSRQYEKFWENPLGSNPLWVSMLFSMISISEAINDASRSEAFVRLILPGKQDHMVTASAHCLILGEFSKAQPMVVEALALHGQSLYLRSLDPSKDALLVFAILVRMAFRMGYHRDSDYYPKITVFEGEMRRRTWAMVMQYDQMMAFQLGLPSNIVPGIWDTKLPSNLHDEDFDEDDEELPPARPSSEPSSALYFMIKQQILSGFSKICRHIMTLTEKPGDDVIKLDAEFRKSNEFIPEVLRWRPLSESITDEPDLIMWRLDLESFRQKCFIVLHRGAMGHGSSYSRKVCTEAAMTITTNMCEVHNEFGPNGRLHSKRWMVSNFSMSDFWIANMVLCYVVSRWGIEEDSLDPKVTAEPAELKNLRLAYDICFGKSLVSNESRKVAAIIAATIRQYEKRVAIKNSQSSAMPINNLVSPNIAEGSQSTAAPCYLVNYMFEKETESPLGKESEISQASCFPMESFFNESSTVNWDQIDQILMNSGQYPVTGTDYT
jgi:hypothetical protein